ncbi:MAG: 2-hydroxychromene-2-carboxylate isomerase [Burkholderiales bacterium]
MPAPIEFYFDFSSPYGYLASCRIDEIAAKHGRATVWRPILLGAILKITGAQPLTSVPLKGDYSKHDMARSARLMGIPFKFPSVFPIASQAPARATYWLSDSDPTKAKELSKAYYRAFFVDDVNISDPQNAVSVAVNLGLDKDAVAAAINDPRIKERLKNEVDSAIAKGVFASPFIIVDGEPFWGSDRLDQIERWLATGGW